MPAEPIRVKVKTSPKTQVFVIESLKFEEEKEEKYFEGRIFSQILSLNGKGPIYYYIRTQKELQGILQLFSESTYSYLHFSCHGNEKELHTTLEEIDFKEFSKIIATHINRRHLIISESSSVNDTLADTIFQETGCVSLIGSATSIEVSDATMLWASFYHLIATKEESDKDIISILQQLANVFHVSLNYYITATSETKDYDKKGNRWVKKKIEPESEKQPSQKRK